jgi:hypothetical protein
MKPRSPEAIIRAALARIVEHFDEVRVGKSATKAEIEKLVDKTGPLPAELLTFYRVANGVVVRTEDTGVDGTMYSTRESRREYVREYPRLVPIAEDGCGNYECVLRGKGPGEGAVVFWDHEEGGISHLIAGSVSAYVDLLARDLCTNVEPDGTRDLNADAPWLEEAWLKKHDPKAKALLSDPKFRALLAVSDGDEDEDEDDGGGSETTGMLHDRILEGMTRGLKPVVKQQLKGMSVDQLVCLRDELAGMAQAECLLVILDAANTKVPGWLAEQVRADASADSVQIGCARYGAAREMLEAMYF